MQDLVKAKVAGQIAVLPDEALVKIIIQAVVTSMKLPGGLLGAAAAPAPATSQSIVLTAGQTLAISVAL